MSTRILLVALAAIFCLLLGYIVHRTGKTAGIVVVVPALGAFVAELVDALNRLL
ncbi:hypothetical protein [Mycobacterium sp. 1245111.1]|uniref:hypothetical protein n=1 Tax=Mycobacterium sp. 1245111.1 TaxID=1834073 RepID=UPI000B026EFA|nr:hypothetical protein [Mycobacterium sp. 1245111.1]